MNQSLTDTYRIPFQKGRQTFFAEPFEIIRLESWSNYTYVYFINQPPVLMAKVLGHYENILGQYDFIRTHRSHLINARYVRSIDENGNIRMSDASHAEISRRRKSGVKRYLRVLFSGNQIHQSKTQP